MKIISAILFFRFYMCKRILPNSSDTIFWRSDYKLTWDDFQGIPEKNSPYPAISHCGFSYSYSSVNNKNKFVVRSYFCKCKSWVIKDTVKKNNLIHEQGHFDIREIFARRLLIELNKIVETNKTTSVIAKAKFKELSKQRELMDLEYDKETQFSTNTVKQTEWKNKIKQWLKDTPPLKQCIK